MTNSQIKKSIINGWYDGHDVIVEVIGDEYEYNDYSNCDFKDFFQKLNEHDHGVIILEIRNKQNVIDLGKIEKWRRKSPHKNNFKIFAVDYIQKPQLDKALGKMDIRNIILPNISHKALKNKLDLWLKSIRIEEQAHVRDEAQAIQSGKVGPAGGNSIEFMDAEDYEDEIFYIESKKDCKKVMSHWFIKLDGVSDAFSHWKKVGRNTWKYELYADYDHLITGSGNWYFVGGSCPEFNWKECKWFFKGIEMTLLFRTKEGDSFYKILIDSECRFIYENSILCQQKLGDIRQSYNPEVTLDNERKAPDLDDSIERENTYNSSHMKGDLNSNDNLGGALQGKGKSDRLKCDPLSGAINKKEKEAGPLAGQAKTDKKQIDPLSRAINNQEAAKGPLSGKGTTERRESDPLSGPGKSDKLKSFWESHNPYENDAAKKKKGNTFDSEIEEYDPDKAELEKEEVDLELVSTEAPKFSFTIIVGDSRFMATFDDMFEEYLILKAGKYRSIEGDNIKVSCQYKYQDSRGRINSPVELEEIIEDEFGSIITFKIPNDKREEFEVITKLSNSRQENINYFLSHAIG